MALQTIPLWYVLWWSESFMNLVISEKKLHHRRQNRELPDGLMFWGLDSPRTSSTPPGQPVKCISAALGLNLLWMVISSWRNLKNLESLAYYLFASGLQEWPVQCCWHAPNGSCIAVLYVWVALIIPGCVLVCLRFAVGVGSSGVCMFHVLILVSILVLNCEVLWASVVALGAVYKSYVWLLLLFVCWKWWEGCWVKWCSIFVCVYN